MIRAHAAAERNTKNAAVQQNKVSILKDKRIRLSQIADKPCIINFDAGFLNGIQLININKYGQFYDIIMLRKH